MPEFTAPGLGKKSNTVTIELEVGENTSGVLYALGGASGGLCCYMDGGYLVSLDYSERRPFEYDGKIDKVAVTLK